MANERGRVFLIAQPSVKRDGTIPDLSSLAEFGQMIVLIGSDLYPSYKPEKAIAQISERLADFDHTRDMIVWAGGDTLAAIMAGAILMDLDVPWFWFLRYDRVRDPVTQRYTNERVYTRIRIDLFEESLVDDTRATVTTLNSQ